MEPEKKLKNFTPTGSCPVRDVLCRLGDKWSMLVLLTLNANGVMRFSEIHRTLGDISHRMLTVTLRMLETDGMIRRSLRRGSAAGGIPSYGAGRESSAAYFRTGGMGRGEQGGYSGRPQEVLNDIRRASVPSG